MATLRATEVGDLEEVLRHSEGGVSSLAGGAAVMTEEKRRVEDITLKWLHASSSNSYQDGEDDNKKSIFGGGKDPESGVLNMLGGRYLLDPRRAT